MFKYYYRFMGAIASTFWDTNTRVTRMTSFAEDVLKAVKARESNTMTPMMTPQGHFLFFKKDSKEIIGIMQINKAAYSIGLILNSAVSLSNYTYTLETIVKHYAKGELDITGTEIAVQYLGNMPMILTGEAAKNYLADNKKDSKINLKVVKPEHLN